MVVGHWPVTLYDPRIPSAAPIIDRARHIISIDGGCVLKLDGQLNALIIPEESSPDFSWTAYDGLPTARALDPQAPSEDSLNIRWGRNRGRGAGAGTGVISVPPSGDWTGAPHPHQLSL